MMKMQHWLKWMHSDNLLHTVTRDHLPEHTDHFRSHPFTSATTSTSSALITSTITSAEDYSTLRYAITRLQKLGNIVEALGEPRMTLGVRGHSGTL